MLPTKEALALETCLTFRGGNRGRDKPLLQEVLEHGLRQQL